MKVFVYPHYSNPYQTMLYNEMSNIKSLEFEYFDEKYLNKHGYFDRIFFPIPLLTNRLKGFNVFHIHWQNFVFYTPVHKLNKPLSFIFTLSFLIWLKIFRYKVIWTIHNIVPHEPVTSNDMLVTKILCKWSDMKIANSAETIEKLKKLHLNTKNTVVIPLGSFIDYYKNTISALKARNELKVDKDAFVVLYFGLIRDYKGVDTLLKTAEKLPANKNIHIVIAGNTNEKKYIDELNRLASLSKINISLLIKDVPDDEIQVFMNAADIVVFPFKRITTSSSILLALSFTKPVIYPLMGPFKELPVNIGIAYDPKDPSGLHKAILSAQKNRATLKTLGNNGYRYAKSLNWGKIAEDIWSIYKSA